MNQMIAILVFCLVMAAIISDKIHRSVAAVAGAVLLLATGVLDVDAAVSYVDVNTIGVLTGMMLFVAVVKNSGLFEYIAIKSAKLTKGQPVAIMVVFIIITAVLSAFLDNVTTVLLIGPMTIAITQILNINPIPFLLTQIMASNVGGTATLIGDPPNIMIGSAAGLGFMEFITHTGVAVIFVLLAVIIVFYFMYRGQMHVSDSDRQKVMMLDENTAIKDKPLLMKSVIMIAFVVIGFMAHSQLGLESSTIALVAAAVMMLIGKQDAEEMILEIEWPTILFFIGLFVVVGGLQSTGVITILANKVLVLIRHNELVGILLILWISAIISAFLDNIPFVATLIPLLLSLAAGGVNIEPMWWALSLGACLGGNGTLIGASANVVLAGVSAKNGYPITFMQYLKVGFPLTVMMIVISTVYLVVCYA